MSKKGQLTRSLRWRGTAICKLKPPNSKVTNRVEAGNWQSQMSGVPSALSPGPPGCGPSDAGSGTGHLEKSEIDSKIGNEKTIIFCLVSSFLSI